MSPVYAPALCSLMSCAPRRILESRRSLETSHNAVNGGQTTMSTSFMFASSFFRSPTRTSASVTVLFIFQFPAIISLRSLFISEIRFFRLKCLTEPLQEIFSRRDAKSVKHRALSFRPKGEIFLRSLTFVRMTGQGTVTWRALRPFDIAQGMLFCKPIFNREFQICLASFWPADSAAG